MKDMKQEEFNKITKPRDCVVAFGIPTSKSGYNRSRQAAGSYACRYDNLGEWNGYHHLFLRRCKRIISILKKLGAQVKLRVSCTEFGELFGSSYHAIVLFSHWNNGAVEFSDGLVKSPGVINSIKNKSFSGVVDLTVCQCRELADDLKLDVTQCSPHFSDMELSPIVWLYFYWALFKCLHDNNLSYLDALVETAGVFLKVRDEWPEIRD